MKAFVIGFPKSGTTTMHQALVESGLRSAHWKCDKGYCGQLIYRSFVAGRPPLEELEDDFDVVAQADVCLPKEGLNYWPNLDFSVLAAIRDQHPECRMILNYRDSDATARSIEKWYDLQARIVASDIPGSPAGAGGTVQELAHWIDAHHRAIRRFFAGDPQFVEIDITAPTAQAQLSEAVGSKITWWGRANANAAPRQRTVLGQMRNAIKKRVQA